MYTSFNVKNFRCFKDFVIKPLARVNLVAGKNNVGKTALLEALWLHAGPDVPNLGIRVDTFRGMPNPVPEELFRDLFHRFDRDGTIALSATGDWGKASRDLQIKVQDRQTTQVTLTAGTMGDEQAVEDRSTAQAIESSHEIVLKYTDESGQLYTSRGWLVQQQVGPGIVTGSMRMSQERVPGRPDPVYLAARHRPTAREDADRFSKFEIETRENEIVEVLKLTEPRLKRLTIVAEHGSPTVYGDTGIGRLLPVPLMGDGMARLLSLALSFGTAQGAIVLFDEVENGLHHTIMADVWKALARFARNFNVQIVATTHSHECVRSAHEAFKEDEVYDFRLHRLDRSGDDIKAVTFDQQMLETALQSGLELR